MLVGTFGRIRCVTTPSKGLLAANGLLVDLQRVSLMTNHFYPFAIQIIVWCNMLMTESYLFYVDELFALAGCQVTGAAQKVGK